MKNKILSTLAVMLFNLLTAIGSYLGWIAIVGEGNGDAGVGLTLTFSAIWVFGAICSVVIIAERWNNKG
jgi:hypothetical protein